MKFKVGDKVKFIGNYNNHVSAGEKTLQNYVKEYKNIFTIEQIYGNGRIKLKGINFWFFIEKELEFVEYTYLDLEKSPIGTKITFEYGEVLIKDDKDSYENLGYGRKTSDFVNLKDNCCSLGKIIKIEEPEYKIVYRCKPEILDKVEKRYLKCVIEPFRNNIKCIVKHNYLISPSLDKYYEGINIIMKDTQIIEFPFFKVDTMYKNMKIDKEYSLEELGI